MRVLQAVIHSMTLIQKGFVSSLQFTHVIGQTLLDLCFASGRVRGECRRRQRLFQDRPRQRNRLRGPQFRN